MPTETMNDLIYRMRIVVLGCLILLATSMGFSSSMRADSFVDPLGYTCADAIRVCHDISLNYNLCNTNSGTEQQAMAGYTDIWFYFDWCQPCATDPGGLVHASSICFFSDNLNAELIFEGSGPVTPDLPMCGFEMNSLQEYFSEYDCNGCEADGPLQFMDGLLFKGCYPGINLFHVRITGACRFSICIDFKFDPPCCNSNSDPEVVIPCTDCISDLGFEPGKKYVVSSWVSQSNADGLTTVFEDPRITITFLPGGEITTLVATSAFLIIDGWQKVETEVEVPGGTTSLKIEFACASDRCYFDDIRIHPKDASMKTYVYDSSTLRLVSELDERNYATFYEYDEEGRLIRIKKETERGIMTIQENVLSTVKNPNN
jgi:hypothetical protein